jgi:hypothetical protein
VIPEDDDRIFTLPDRKWNRKQRRAAAKIGFDPDLHQKFNAAELLALGDRLGFNSISHPGIDFEVKA